VDDTGVLPRQPNDDLIYLPAWNKDASLDLTSIQYPADPNVDADRRAELMDGSNLPFPGAAGGHPRYNMIGGASGWTYWWEKEIADRADDFLHRQGQAFVLLSLYQRLVPPKERPNSNDARYIELLRRDGRHFDVSNAVAAGRLVILADVPDAPDPAPLFVDGDPPAGTGTVYTQFILPLDRSSLLGSAAVPTTQQNLNQINKDIGNLINNGDK
jgi:hypothetical protein